MRISTLWSVSSLIASSPVNLTIPKAPFPGELRLYAIDVHGKTGAGLKHVQFGPCFNGSVQIERPGTKRIGQREQNSTNFLALLFFERHDVARKRHNGRLRLAAERFQKTVQRGALTIPIDGTYNPPSLDCTMNHRGGNDIRVSKAACCSNSSGGSMKIIRSEFLKGTQNVFR